MILQGNLLDKNIKFSNCPLCGDETIVEQIGNEYSKKKTIKVKCRKCFVNIVQSVLIPDFKWLQQKMAERWNKRVI